MPKHVCSNCRRPTGFRTRGRWHTDRDHDLCARCYRAEMNRKRTEEG